MSNTPTQIAMSFPPLNTPRLHSPPPGLLSLPHAGAPPGDPTLPSKLRLAVDSIVIRHLTRREIEVLSWIALGKTDWQIAQILLVSPKTVNYHVERAKRKLEVVTRSQAVVIAHSRGLLRRLQDLAGPAAPADGQ